MKNSLLLNSTLAVFILAGCSAPPATNNNANAPANTAANANAAPTATPASAASGEAKTYTHEEAGVQFTVPAGWKTDEQGEVLTITSADDNVGIMFWVPSENDFDAAVKSIEGELDKIVKNPKFNEQPEEGTINGMRYISQSGTGEIEGKNAEWDVTVLDAKKPVFVVSFFDAAAGNKHDADLTNLVKSIKKI